MSPIFGGSSSLNADGGKGNFAVGVQGNVTQLYIHGDGNLVDVAATAPSLDVSELKYAIEDGKPNIASLLQWRYRLVETLYGREEELRTIENWVNDERPEVLIRLVEGEGGSGKTRLAAEAALRLRATGWSAGFLARSGTLNHPSGEQGLFLIIDYPEEQPERIKQLVEAIRDRRRTSYRLRLLLLSRRRYEDWGDTFGPIQDLVGKHPIAQLGPLSTEQAKGLIIEASERLKQQLRKPATDLQSVDEWLGASEENRLSLYATAAAVHHVLAPVDTFGLAAPEIVADLVSRELARVAEASRAAKLGEHALPRLLALATITGQLTIAAIERLTKPEQQIFECPNNLVIDRLCELPWWDRDDQTLPALTPDVLAAVLTSRVLKERPDKAPDWLWAVLQDGIGPDFAARIGRVIHDIDQMEEEPAKLPDWLEQIVGDDPSRAPVFDRLTFDQWLPHRMADLAATAGLAMAARVEDEESVALILNNTSASLITAGRKDEALRSIKRAVMIYERLAGDNPARFEFELAGAFNNLATMLANTKDMMGALRAAKFAVEIYQRLAGARPAYFEPDLAMSLANLANRLSDTGQNAGALETAKSAAEIYERLADTNPARFEPYLAGSLNNLATFLSGAGDSVGALEVGQRAIDIYKRLAMAHPGRFEPDVANSLMNYAMVAKMAGDLRLSSACANRALPIWWRLAETTPRAFLPRLLQVLDDCARIFTAAEMLDEAEAVQNKLAELTEVIENAHNQSKT